MPIFSGTHPAIYPDRTNLSVRARGLECGASRLLESFDPVGSMLATTQGTIWWGNVMFRLRTLSSLGLAAFLASCSDGVGPLDDQVPANPPPGHLVTDTTRPDVLQLVAGAPQLVTYDTTFWAVQGHPTNLTVHYMGTNPETGEPDMFLKLTVPRTSQLVDAAGNQLAEGDSLLISVRVSEVELAVELGPHGTIFAEQPLEFVIDYAYADLSNDESKSEADLALWYQPIPGEPWSLLSSQIDYRGKWVIAYLDHFSNYAVAWME